MEQEFFASCLSGFESALAVELKELGIERVRPLSGGVAFFCELEGAYRACLWSRLASRVMMVIARVNAGDAELLYAGAYAVAWEDVLADGVSFNVRASGVNDELRNTRFTALKVKDAVADRLREKAPDRAPSVPGAARASIDVRVHNHRATLSFDFAGEALNRRSYLTADDKRDAPLECTLVAGALAMGAWAEAAQRGAALVDPACRDGLLVVEAASIACDAAPGLMRERWGFTSWAGHDAALWKTLVDEARRRFDEGKARLMGVAVGQLDDTARPEAGKVRIVGTSTSSPAISRAREHVRRAGLRSVVSIELGDASSAPELVERVSQAARRTGRAQGGSPGEPCVVASNVDARSRRDARAHVQADEAAFVAACATVEAAPGQHVCFIAVGADDVEGRFGHAPAQRSVVGRERTETVIDVYDAAPMGTTRIEVPDLQGGAPHFVEVLEPATEQFAARLRKVFKERRKWAKREHVTCYRLYDSDLPDYAVAIDWYTGAGDARGNAYLHIAEYAAPSSVDPIRAQRRFADVLAVAPVVCGVRPDHVFSKRRVRERGGQQYRNAGSRAYVTTVEEGGYVFEVDLAARLDTGLFLDHRVTREMIGAQAKGKTFLNLFAYTGSASVHAAGGGAVATTTVDMSQTYLDWARRNMAANGFKGKQHEFIRADVLRWITEARRARKRYDLVFVDPPTFSNSKAMGKKTWDVQRDHVELLIGVSHLLSEGGTAVFSCNLRNFKPDVEALERYGVAIEDISPDTIPADFARTPKIHKCYVVHRA